MNCALRVKAVRSGLKKDSGPWKCRAISPNGIHLEENLEGKRHARKHTKSR